MSINIKCTYAQFKTDRDIFYFYKIGIIIPQYVYNMLRIVYNSHEEVFFIVRIYTVSVLLMIKSITFPKTLVVAAYAYIFLNPQLASYQLDFLFHIILFHDLFI